jgi:chromosome segregation ATPase
VSAAMSDGRKADSARRRQRVVKAIDAAGQGAGRISVSAIARHAGVDRTFLYRHPDLLALVHAAEAEPAQRGSGSEAATVSRASLQADLAHAQARNARLAARIQLLEKRLSSELGEQAWRESGLGVPTDIDDLQRRLTALEQRNVELTAALEESQADLGAAREANRDLTRALNQRG